MQTVSETFNKSYKKSFKECKDCQFKLGLNVQHMTQEKNEIKAYKSFVALSLDLF